MTLFFIFIKNKKNTSKVDDDNNFNVYLYVLHKKKVFKKIACFSR